MDDDEDEEEFGGLFENGHWSWCDNSNQLVFYSDLPPPPPELEIVAKKVPTGTVDFRDDVDLIEQMRYRRRYQRKPNPNATDVIHLQDCKDLALFTAPLSILSKYLIQLLHCPTTERLLRALIMYCQYYLQVERTMKTRMAELVEKIRTPHCLEFEEKMRNDLSDLRVLVAKEYCTFIAGGADLRKFHHMGAQKETKSLSGRDARLVETTLRMFVQIIWLALARKSFNNIELEVHRLFKSDLFNIAEHKLRTNYVKKMPPEQRRTLFGVCNKMSTKLYQKSPLYNEVFCNDTGFRLTGLAVTGFLEKTYRLEFLEAVIAAPEETFNALNITIGILGLERSRFDTMLNEIRIDTEKSTFGKSKSSFVKRSSMKFSKVSQNQSRVSRKGIVLETYPNIVLPPREKEDYFPETYPSLPPKYPIKKMHTEQELKWLKRFERLTETAIKRSSFRLHQK